MTGALLWAWGALRENHEALAVLASFVGITVAGIVAFAALKQARTAARQAQTAAQQAQIARERHEAQTEADLQRRIGESYTKAVEQLGSDKLPVRLGGIYTLERISDSKESPRDYWTVMETLTAFVRERARWQEPDDTDPSRTDADEPRGRPEHRPPTDIQAVLTVIVRRSEANRTRETKEGWRLDLRRTDLREADLSGAHLEGAVLAGAHLEKAFLKGAHLEGADLGWAHLEGAVLKEAHLEGAVLKEAHLEGAVLAGAHLEGAFLGWAHLEGAVLGWAHLEGTFLKGAHLERANLNGAHLEGADLSWAHLEGAVLGWAHLEGADLNGAHLEGADLGWTHLEGAKDLTQVQLEGAFGNANTELGDAARPAGR